MRRDDLKAFAQRVPWASAAAGAGGALGVLAIWLFCLWPLTKDISAALSGWVQAIGSVVAIWAAGRMAARPHLAVRAERASALCGVTHTAAAVLKGAMIALRQAREAGAGVEFDLSRFDRALRLLRSIPIVETGASVMVDRLVTLEEVLIAARTAMEEAAPHWLGAPPAASTYETIELAREYGIEVDAEATQMAIDASRAERNWLFGGER